MTSAYFAPLVTLPTVITRPGSYVTRCGEIVSIKTATTSHVFGCHGIYSTGQRDSWHRSGRLFAGMESANDIVRPAEFEATYVLHGRRFAIAAEFPDTDEGTKAANAFMEANAGTGVLAVADGRVIIATMADKGVPA